MRKITRLLIATALVLLMPALAHAQTRALLVGCTDFVSQTDLGYASSGNLQMIGSALLGANPALRVLSIEDGTLGTQQALQNAIENTFGDAETSDLSIFYLCTHGVLSASEEERVCLLLSDGTQETLLSGQQLYDLFAGIQGEKLLILDACYSGALIGHDIPLRGMLPGVRAPLVNAVSPFLADPSFHVLTSAGGQEAGWYYDSNRLSTGAVSYFASAFANGLGLFGTVEADENKDGTLTLREMHRYLLSAVPSSSSQLLSACPDALTLPIARDTVLSSPLTGFTYGASLLPADNPTLDFSFTVTQACAVQYRLVEYGATGWMWDDAQTFLDQGDGNDMLQPGRKSRELTLPGVTAQDSGYIMLQVFSVTGNELLLCSEHLFAVQGEAPEQPLSITATNTLTRPAELSIQVLLTVPAELTLSVFDADGRMVCRLAQGQLTRPSPRSTNSFYWDGCGADGMPVPDGDYVIAAEAIIGDQREKATADVHIGV